MHKLYEPAVFVDNYKYCKCGRRNAGIWQIHKYAFVLFWVHKLYWLSAKQYIINRENRVPSVFTQYLKMY